jgi:hypothetical protein
LADAIRYALTRWSSLCCFLDDGYHQTRSAVRIQHSRRLAAPHGSPGLERQDALPSLQQKLAELVFGLQKLFTDDTPIPVLDPGAVSPIRCSLPLLDIEPRLLARQMPWQTYTKSQQL